MCLGNKKWAADRKDMMEEGKKKEKEEVASDQLKEEEKKVCVCVCRCKCEYLCVNFVSTCECKCIHLYLHNNKDDNNDDPAITLCSNDTLANTLKC